MGGHSDPDEHDSVETALREATEESGLRDLVAVRETPLDVDAHLIPARKSEAAHHHLDFRYVFRTETPDAIAISDESHDLRWFAPAECGALGFDAALQRAVGKLVG